jgi:hypothetical protein
VSDARTDFFASGGKSKPAPSREDFFSGNVDVSEPKKAPSFTSPYAYYDPEVRRAANIQDEDLTPLQEVAPGFNRGVAGIMGLPMDTATSAVDLLGMGYGVGASLVTGKPAGEFYEPYDRSQVPGTGDWFAQKMDSSPLGPVTQMVNPEGAGHRLLYNIGAGAPGSMIGGQGSIAPSMVGTAAGAIAGEAGADPATQAVASLLGGYGASRLMDSPLAPSKAREVEEETPQQKLNSAASKQSMGAAGAAVDLQKLSPDLRMAVEKAVQQTGGAVNPDVLARQIQADSLPVKVRLSEGQALGDERLISLELNARGKHEAYSKGFAEQNKALTQNLRVLRDEIGPDVFTTNPVEHADTIISRYKAIDEAANTEIAGKYQALRDAAGGQFPVDAPALLANVRSALKKDLATSKAPSDVMALLEEKAAVGTMTLEDFESLRSSLARTQRSASDGQERHAAGVIRRQIEEMPLQPGAEQLKGLADEARAAARTRFQALEADPAYKAAVTDSVPPDRFVQKFVIGGHRDNVERLSAAMSGDDAAVQTVKVATLEHLRKAAGIDNAYNGNFTQAGYNKALQGLEPKLGFLFDQKTAEAATTLGDVARYTQFQPKGSWANNSNTDVAAAAREYGKDVLVGTLDAKTFGIPIASKIAERMERGKVEKEAAKTFAPGAGLTRLSDLTKLEKK